MRTNRKKTIKLAILVLILLLGIGYAAIATTLKIDGTVNVSKSTWDVHFENVSITEGSVTANPAPTTNDTDTTEMSYTINFTKPGDFFEFTTDIVNDGTIDAMVELVSNNAYANASSTTPITLPSYLKSTLTYADGGPIQQNHLLAKKDGNNKTVETVKVRIEFKKDISVSDLPSSGDTTVVFKFIGKYKQADENAFNRKDCSKIVQNVLANPNSYKPAEQTLTNDIGIDKYCNIVNMDWWIDKEYCTGEKIYNIDTTSNEVTLGKGMCGDDDTSWKPIYTAATSAANVEDGEWKLTFPQYIYDENTQEIYPVTEIKYVFSNTWLLRETGAEITQIPEIPSTVTTLGENFFNYQETLETVIIPKNIKNIGEEAFYFAFNHKKHNNTLIFEQGSQLETIGIGAFNHNDITGNLILPQTVNYIGERAFKYNNITSVTFPSTATYNTTGGDRSFDSGVTINHQY